MSRFTQQWTTELGWAWRNVRARGWRAGLSVALLAIALAANATVFSAADALVFNRVPYDDAERLVEIRRQDPKTGRLYGAFMSARLLGDWRRQTDLFAAVHGSLTKNLFLAGNGEPEQVRVADVTVGLIEMLGAKPRWGRSLVDGDDRQLDLQPVLLAESLARKRFGDPSAAIGQRLETTGEPLLVVGVMAEDFRFPDGVQQIWRALDPAGPLTRNFGGVSSIARLAPGASIELADRMVRQRSTDIGRAAGLTFAYSALLGPLQGSLASSEQRRLFLVLLGAAACLLLIACANVVSLELAAAVQRARTYAIQLAIGASRAGLARTAMLEGACLVGAATAVGLLLARSGSGTIVAALPPRFAFRSANPIDLDERAFLFMAAAAAVTWLVAALPVVVYASRGNLMDLLKLEGHAVAASGRSGLVRRALTVVEVALAVMLLAGSVVYVRSYRALIALDKGFDTAGVVTIGLSIPPQAYRSVAEKRALAREAVERLRARPGVVAAADIAPPPSTGANYGVTSLEVDNRPPIHEDITIAELDVVPDYFSVLRIPLRRGRMFDAVEPPANVIIGEAFAERYWPGEDPVGRRFRRDPRGAWHQVIGVAGHVRSSQDPPGARSGRAFQTYRLRQPPPPASPQTASSKPALETGGSFGFLTLMARVDSRERAGDLYQTVRAIDSRFILKLEFVDDVYAQQFDDRLLATRVIGAFGILAFLIAAAGIYGVMLFLVADRTREIGIRMALGADRRRIGRLVVGSSMRLVALGAALGVAGAIAASRAVQSQLFGVSATDPATLALVTLGVAATALLATWQPARQAARIDPKVLLKN
jgi:putative ABC transport system permease protein